MRYAFRKSRMTVAVNAHEAKIAPLKYQPHQGTDAVERSDGFTRQHYRP